MALITPTNLYSGAAQVFDTRSHLAFQARLLAQERAKQDALDAYYRKLPLTINEKGVRDQERPVISNSLLGIKKYYIENKDKIRKGDQAAAYNYEKMVREHQNLVEESQKEGLTGLQLGKLLVNPQTAYISQNKELMDRIHAHSLPIDDPNHVSLDIEELTLPPKPYDRTTYFKNFAQLKGNDNPPQVVDNKDGTETVSISKSYDEPQKHFVMAVAGDKYLHDPSFTKMVDEDLGEANASNVLNDDFKKEFGHDIETPIDLATAYTFNGLKPEPIKQKRQPDQLAMTKQKQAFELKKMGINDAYIRGRQKNAESLKETYKKFTSSADAGEQDNVLNKFNDISLQTGTNKLNGATVDHIAIGGENYKGKFVEVPNNMKKEYRRIGENDKKEPIWVYPDRFYMTDDKKYVVPIFLGRKTGTNENNYIKEGSTPIPIHVWKKQLAKGFVTLKETGAEVTDDGDLSNDLENEAPQSPTKTTTTETHTKTIKTSTGKLIPVIK